MRPGFIIGIKLFRPEYAIDGPGVDHLEDERVTAMRTMYGETTTVSDNWRDPTRTDLTTKCTWTGVTVFNEKGYYPQLLLDDYAEEALVPKTLNTPKESTQEERELHNLTHMPCRAWCPLCVRCKGVGDYHKQVYDKKPVIQVDYSFVTQKEEATKDYPKGKNLTATVLSAVDVTTGMVTSFIVENKGPNEYSVNELQRFVIQV